jgi:hypothetical protein
MRKSLLVAFACLFGMQAIAQSGAETAIVKNKYNSGISSKSLVQASTARQGGTPAIATTIFSEDFASGIPAGWTNVDLSGGGEIFRYTTTGSTAGPVAAVALNPVNTTAANGYVIFDSDSAGQASGPEDAELTTSAINCTGYNTVFMSLNEVFVQYSTGVGEVAVSNDGINWTIVHNAETGLGQNQSTANPFFVQADISSVAANQATVYLRFKWTGDWDWFWMFDDVTLYEPAATDAGITAITGINSGCNLSSSTPVSVTVRNYGGSAISNVPVSFSVNGGTPVTETVAGPIASNSDINYTFTATANLSAAGTFDIVAYSSLTGDAAPVNDSTSITVDNLSPTSLASPYTMDFEPGEDLSAWAVSDENGDGTSWALANTLAFSGTQCIRKAGSGDFDDDWVWTNCFDLQAGTTYTLDYWYRQFDLQAPCSLEVLVGTAQNVASTTQLIATEVIDSIYFNSVNNFTVASSGSYHIAFHAFLPITAPTTGSSSLRVDLVTLSLATSLNENANPGGVSVFPNPTSGIFNLRVMKFENANVRIFDAIGKEVFNTRMNDTQTLIDLSNQSNGLYFVQVEGRDFSYTQKVTVE